MFIVLVGILTLSKSEAKISQEFTEVPLPPLVPLVPLVGEDREVEAHRLVFPSRRYFGPGSPEKTLLYLKSSLRTDIMAILSFLYTAQCVHVTDGFSCSQKLDIIQLLIL